MDGIDQVSYLGQMVNREALHLCLDLELQGVRLSVDDGRIYPSPMAAVTEAQRADLARLRWHVLDLVSVTVPTSREDA